MRAGLNQYPPMAGVPVLREAIARKIETLYGRSYDPGDEITITAGATQAILTAILCRGASGRRGDRARARLRQLRAQHRAGRRARGARGARRPARSGPTSRAIAAAITPRTRAIIVNTPHNPSATVWTRDDMERLAELLRPTDVLLIADEVYEHMVFDGVAHASASGHPELAARAFVVSSFGKTYHVTGWKVGYVAAPKPLTAEFRKVHQFNVFTVNTPVQHGLARYMDDPKPYLELSAFYQRKRDLFRAGLAKTRLKLLPSQGSYFQCVDYSAVSDRSEEDFCRWLTTDLGVAAIPLSAFYDDGRNQQLARFCFAKRDETLNTALDRLARL